LQVFNCQVPKGRGLREECPRTIELARTLGAEALTLQRTLSDRVNQAYRFTPAEIAPKWQTAPPRMPSLLPQQDRLSRNHY
jgi:hypothetical protein